MGTVEDKPKRNLEIHTADGKHFTFSNILANLDMQEIRKWQCIGECFLREQLELVFI